MKLLLACSLLALFTTPSAFARNFRLGLVGSYGITGMNQVSTGGAVEISETEKSHNVGAGMLMEFGLIGPIGFELGAYFQPRGYKDVTSLDEVKYNTSLYTAMFRFDFGQSSGKMKLPVSLGLGAYYSQALDDQVTSVDGGTKAVSKRDFSDATLPLGAMGKIDRGLIGSLAVVYPVSKVLLLTVDFRYLHGLTDVVTPEDNIEGNWTEISTVAGIVFDF